MTSAEDLRLNGRAPEFSLMSLKPGIGLDAMHDVASTLLEFDLDKTQADVPVSLRHGARQLPLGRYLRKNLRTFIGKEENAPQEALDEYQKKMLPLYEASLSDAEVPSIAGQARKRSVQAIRRMTAISKLRKKRGSL